MLDVSAPSQSISDQYILLNGIYYIFNYIVQYKQLR